MGEKKRIPLLKEGSNFLDWIYFLSESSNENSEELILHGGLIKASELNEKESSLVLSLSGLKGKNIEEEKVGYLSSISTEDSISGIDYAVLGDFKNYYGKTLFYTIFVLIFIEMVLEKWKKKKNLKKRKGYIKKCLVN